MLLDMDAKINVMTKKLIENTNLATKSKIRLRLTLYTSYRHFFLAYINN